MRNVIFLCLAILVGNSYAQTPLTNGEVYNYEVGDVFQTGYQSGSSFNFVRHILTRTILNKNVLSNDAVSYEIREQKNTIYFCSSCPPTPTYAEQVLTQTISNLSQPISPPENLNTVGPQRCFNLGMADSLNSCGERVLSYYSEIFDSTFINCIEPDGWSRTYIEGVGSFYHNIDGVNNSTVRTYLIAYTKNGVTCGNMLPVGTQNKTTALDLSVFPNPITNQLSIAGDAPIETYKIFDLNGACVQMGTISGKNIDVSALPKGNFIGVFYAPNGDFVRQKLTKL